MSFLSSQPINYNNKKPKVHQPTTVVGEKVDGFVVVFGGGAVLKNRTKTARMVRLCICKKYPNQNVSLRIFLRLDEDRRQPIMRSFTEENRRQI
jgi:hypothetical protein